MVYLQFKKEKDIDYHFISNGGTLFLIKFLHEHKQIIKNFIKSNPKKVDIKKFLNKLKKLVQYDFKTEEYTLGTPSEYISDILFEILHFQYGQNFRVKEIFERNMTKDYLYSNFELWWYQSLFMLGGAGYIRNLNDYIKRYWDFKYNIYSEEECLEKTKLTYNRHTVPQIFSNEELRNLEDYISFYSHPPSLYETKYINNDSNYYSDGGRIF